MRVCRVTTPATLDIPEGIPLMPAPQGVPKVALTTVYAQKHLSDAKALSQPVLLKFQSVGARGPMGTVCWEDGWGAQSLGTSALSVDKCSDIAVGT